MLICIITSGSNTNTIYKIYLLVEKNKEKLHFIDNLEIFAQLSREYGS